MKHEQPKAESSIELTISEIKKAEAEKEVEDAVVEVEIEMVAEAIKDEMPNHTEEETESVVEDLEINLEEKERKEAKERLIEYSKEIYKISKKYAAVYAYFEPYGSEGKTFDEEFDKFLEERKNNQEYCLSFEYPKIEKLDIKKLDNDRDILLKIKDRANEEDNDSLKAIINNTIEDTENKIDMLFAVKDKDFNKAFECAKKSFGDIDDELVDFAKDIYEQKNKVFLNNSEKKDKTDEVKENKIKKQLESSVFDAEDFKHYFEMLIKKEGFEKDGWEVIITSKVKSLDVRGFSEDYDHPVILIPEKRDVEADGLKFLKLLSHENIHIITQTYNKRSGFENISFGSDYETFTEGIAMIGEEEIEKEVMDESKEVEINAHPYYVLGMQKTKEGANFAQVFDYLIELRKKELECKKTKKDEIEDEAIKFVKKICRRIFRGFNPKEGGKYFPKDKAYLEGKLGAKKMKEAGVVNYLYELKVDPKMIPHLNKLSAFAINKNIEDAKEIVKQIWKDEKWPTDYIKNKKWYEENTQMDRHWAYREEFMNNDMTGLKNKE